MFKRILVPTDNTELTAKAVKLAIELAKVHGSVIHALYVSNPFYYSSVYAEVAITDTSAYDAQRKLAQDSVKKVFDACVLEGVSCETHVIESPQPWREIVEYAVDAKCDLIVMASQARRGLLGFLFGSETQKVLTRTKVPLLVVRN